MPPVNSHIIASLQKEILSLQGFKPAWKKGQFSFGLGPMRYAFPNHHFPTGAVHEFLCEGPESLASSNGFIMALSSKLMALGGAAVFIAPSRTVFPPALKSFHIDPAKIIFIELSREKDQLWVMEEALKCEGLAAVIGDIPTLDFTASRRLQLAVEQSRVTGFILRRNTKNLDANACVARWKINPVASAFEDAMPGIAYPRWKVELLKIRNGKPGSWDIEWRNGRFYHLTANASAAPETQKKTG
jgi:protein ImuA